MYFNKCQIIKRTVNANHGIHDMVEVAHLPTQYSAPPLPPLDERAQAALLNLETQNMFDRNLPTYVVLAAGGYGTVIAVTVAGEEKRRVLKRMSINAITRDDPRPGGVVISGEMKMKRLRRELQLLTELRHPNVVEFHGYFYAGEPDDLFVNIEMEKVEFSLRDYYNNSMKKQRESVNPNVPEKRQHQFISAMFAQLLLVADYLRRKRCMHRDIKPDNVGINMQGFVVKLFDFGLARGIPSTGDITHDIGTKLYQAPEVYFRARLTAEAIAYNEKVDLWGIVLTVIEYILYERPLFMANDTRNIDLRILEVCGLPLDKYSPTFGQVFAEFPSTAPIAMRHLIPGERVTGQIPKMGITTDNLCDLIGHMLKIDPNERWSVEQCLENEYVKTMAEKFKHSNPAYLNAV